ncbi:MAG: DUF4810 domain-containing protein, partial [Zoogloea sp.]|nr:DUF4810 domain-containing protein [Zoogloea sp.]
IPVYLGENECICLEELRGFVAPVLEQGNWGDYQGQVYGYLKGDKAPEEQILAMEAEMEKARAKGKALPPGYHAHLAMLYGKTGRTDRLEAELAAEKAQFPESTAYVDFLLKNLKR